MFDGGHMTSAMLKKDRVLQSLALLKLEDGKVCSARRSLALNSNFGSEPFFFSCF
jgi:hypothetical protein